MFQFAHYSQESSETSQKKIADCVDKTLYQYEIISLEIDHYFKWLCIQDLNCIYLGQELGRVSRKVWR